MTRIPAKSATTGAILWAILSTSSPLLARGERRLSPGCRGHSPSHGFLSHPQVKGAGV